MAGKVKYDDLVKRASDGYVFTQPFYFENQSNMVQLGNTNFTFSKIGFTKLLPTLPSGVNSYKLIGAELYSQTTTGVLIAKQVLLGSLNLATNVFTDGSAMPVNNGVQLYSTLILEALTPLNATPGSITITFNDRNGSSVSSGAIALGASATIGACGVIPAPGANVGVTDVTAAVQSGGTTPSGTIGIYGLIHLGSIYSKPATANPGVLNNQTHAFHHYPLGAGDKIGIFRHGTNVANMGFGKLIFMGDS